MVGGKSRTINVTLLGDLILKVIKRENKWLAQNGGLTRVWNSKQNNGYQSYGFQDIKKLMLLFV